MTDDKIKTLRNFISWTFVKFAASLATVIGLVWAFTNSVNVHNDWLFWVAVLTGVAIPIVVLWFAVSFFLSLRRFLDAFNSQPLSTTKE